LHILAGNLKLKKVIPHRLASKNNSDYSDIFVLEKTHSISLFSNNVGLLQLHYSITCVGI